MADLPGTPLDTAFTRTLSGRTEAVLDATQPRPSTGLEEFTPDEFDVEDDNDISHFDSFTAAASDSGVATGGIRAARQLKVAPPIDPTYNLEEHLTERPEDLALIQPFLDNPEDAASSSVLHLLQDSQNAETTETIIQRVREAQERAKIAAANGWVPQVAGVIGGIGVDIGILMAVTALSGGTATVPTVLGGAAFRSTAMAGRALATGRLAVIGGVEAAAERAVQRLTNPLIANVDILQAAGLGTGGGALLGFAFPTLFGNVRLLNDDIMNPAKYGDELVDEAASASGRPPQPAGAGVTPTPDAGRRVEPARGAGSLVAGKVIPKGLDAKALRNPKRVITDIGVRGARQFTERGLEGGREFFSVMSRIVRVSPAMADEVGGAAARQVSIQDVRDQFRVTRLSREVAAGKEYASVMKDIFDVGVRGRALRNNNLVQFGRHQLSQEQYEAMADELSVSRAQGFNDVDVIPQEINARLTETQRNTLLQRLQQTSAREDEFYQAFGRQEVELGMIQEDELIPGYRPQRWNRDEIEGNPQAFDNFLLETFSKQPREDWIAEHFTVRKGDSDEFESVLQEGETFSDLAKRDPELANEILDDWSAGIRDEATSKALVIREAREAELKKVRGTALLDVSRRIASRLERDKALFTKLEKQLDQVSTDADRIKLSDRMAKVEKRIADEQMKFRQLNDLSQTGEGIDQFLRRFGNAQQKTAIRKAGDRVKRAANKQSKTAARRLVSEEIAGIRKAITNGDSPFSMIDQEFIQTSSRFKRRSINLGRNRFTPEARRFLLTNSHDARASFDASVSPQLAMRNVFGPILAKEGQTFSVDNMKELALRSYDVDLAKGAKVATDRRQASIIFDEVLRELTNADIAGLRGVNRNISDLVALGNSITAAISLGGVALAQLGDLAVQIMAGGRIGTGFQVMWRGTGVKAMREIAALGEDDIAVIIKGPSVVDASRFRAIADIDMGGFDIPGSRFRRVLRGANEVAMIEGWANLMHVWNTVIRQGFGLDFARQLDRDMGKYASLPAHLRTFYARHGIDGKAAADMADLMNRTHRTAVGGKLRIPDSAAWGDTRPDLLMKYRNVIKSAGDEAMIDPGIADRPFLRSTALGRLILQFQSFMFTAGERFMAPLIQELQLHPTSIRPYFAALAGIYMGAVTDGLKHSVRGEFEEWAERWNTPEGAKDNLWGALMRSPMMAGASSTLTDLAMTQFGRVANDRLEDVAGVRPLREETTRFRENQGLAALAGPAFGTFTGTLPTIARRFADGDIEEATEMLSRRVPIANVFYLQVLSQLARD